jgi:hypothetical protein
MAILERDENWCLPIRFRSVLSLRDTVTIAGKSSIDVPAGINNSVLKQAALNT